MSYEKRGFAEGIVLIYLMIIIVLLSLLGFFRASEILIFSGLSVYIMFFIFRDKKMKRQELKKSLKCNRKWIFIVKDKTLSAEIP